MIKSEEGLFFAMPQKTYQPFNDFLDHVVAEEMRQDVGNVKYAQTRESQQFACTLKDYG